MRLPDELKFAVDEAEKVNLTPQHLHVPEEHAADFQEPVIHQEPMPEEERNVARIKGLYVRQSDLDEFWYSADCPRCQHILRNGPNRSNIAHSEACRGRITECLKATVEGRRRLEVVERRSDMRIAQGIEAQDPRTASSGQGEELRIDGQPDAAADDAAVDRRTPPLSFLLRL